jgi:charged multivesicular body protein 6
MSNQDEDEVEAELDALEAEINVVDDVEVKTKDVVLPNVPDVQPEFTSAEEAQIAKDRKERAARRARERVAQQASQPMLAG